MKRIIISIIAVVAVFGGVAWFANKGSDEGKVAGVSSRVSEFEQVQQAVKNGAKLYDVRTATEYEAGHFENALNWSLQDMQAGKLPDVSKDTKLYVYCRSGNRSGQATKLLEQAGYTNVTDLHGLTNVEAMGGKLAAK